MSFARGANPIWFFNNLTGQVLDDTYYAFFLTNTMPYTSQAVYQDPDGLTPWSNPIEFQPSGGLPNNIYGNPTLVYRIEVRQGPTRTDPLIWQIDNYVFEEGSGSSSIIEDPLLISENMITNPQFADIYFGSPLTIATAGTYNIAPGWFLDLTGIGTTILTQNTTSGSEDIVGNPSYYLTINNSGWTTARLYQRLTNNSSIFNNGAIAIAFSAFGTGSDFNLTVSYIPSTGSSTTFTSFGITASGFTTYKDAINMVPTNNTDVNGAAYSDIDFNMPGTSVLSISNVQLTGQSDPLSANFALNPLANAPNYNELSYERMVDHEFHIYKNSLIREQKDSLLAGWKFALNPWQFYTTATTNVAANQYTADQTIVIQQAYVSSATGNNVSSERATFANNYAYTITAVTNDNQFALLQYIDPSIVRPYWGKVLSSYVKLVFNSTHATTLNFKMRLIYSAGVPNTVSQHDPINSWTAGSDPVINSGLGYHYITPPIDSVYSVTNGSHEFVFENMLLPASTNDNMTLGILLYTTSNMNSSATADSIYFDDISLCANEFAMPTQVQTYNESLARCQFYYEKSYDISVLPGTATTTNGASSTIYVVTTNGGMYGMDRRFKVNKRTDPSVLWYSTQTGAVNKIRSISGLEQPVDSNDLVGTSSTGIPVIIPTTGPTDLYIGQWTADARLGL